MKKIEKKKSNGNLPSIIKSSGKLTSSFLEKNYVSLDDIESVYQKIFYIVAKTAENYEAGGGMDLPAVDKDISVNDDFIVCLEDGKKMKMLRRYLKTKYDLTPEQYKKKWNLPADYPMVAPSYAKKRSRLAKKSGLGKG